MGENGGSVISSFWDTDTSGQTTSDGGTGKTTAEMKILSTFTSAGWDFTNETANGTNDVWAIKKTVDYPKLVWLMVNLVSSRFPFGWYEVNFVDYSAMANWWEAENCAASNDCNGMDFDFSSTVDGNDLAIICNYWLEGI
ncbi:MAG: hypothetical protein DRP62_02860 [Planctomycetota bacterium]|nr:MAG: hypothetical protein DRP62_02860 [Planctomycetota bacterium]